MTRQIMTGSGAEPATRNGASPQAGAPRLGNGAPTSNGALSSPAGVGWGLPLVVLVAGMFMSLLDTNIVNVAIPTIQKEFGATTDDVQWVTTAYALALGVVVPASAWLGDRFGLRRVYNVALLGFAAGSALCGLAWDLNSLVAFRILQAIPGAVLPVLTLTMLYRIVPRERIGAAMGLYGLGIVFAPAIGPTLGGYLVEYVDWRSIFFVNVPVGILATVAAALVLPAFPGQAGRRFDVLGFITIAGGLFALLLALSKGQSWGWDSYRILLLLTLSVLSLALFVVIELEVADPLLDLRVFRHWSFTHSLLLTAVLSVVWFAVLYYIPLFLQQAQGWGAFDTGLTLLPQALVLGVLMPIAGRLYDRIGPRWLVTIGLTIASFSTYQMHVMTLDTSREQIMWWLVWLAAGLALAVMPIITAGLAAIPTIEVGGASVVNNVVRQISASLGLAVLTEIWTTQQAQQLAGRAALLPGDAGTSHLDPASPTGQGLYALHQQTQLHVFVAAMNDLILIAAGLSTLGALAALLMRSGHPATGAAKQAKSARRR
ncbi:MAG: multidrug efflux MFS transporter [Pseudonocardiales bacterium]|nr:multidrug efflux MFS transporter [Pseudonocardiales bacterium]